MLNRIDKARPVRVKCRSGRRGIAMVECAVCLPLIMLLVLGAIEVSNAIFVQQALTSAAYEGANIASVKGGTAQLAESTAKNVLTAMRISDAKITITPPVTQQTPVGTAVQVTCTAPLKGNTFVFGVLPLKALNATVHITRL